MGNEKVKSMIVAESVHLLPECANERRERKGRNGVGSRYR